MGGCRGKVRTSRGKVELGEKLEEVEGLAGSSREK